MFFVGQFSSQLPVILVIILYLFSMSGIIGGKECAQEIDDEVVCDNYNSPAEFTSETGYDINGKSSFEYTDRVIQDVGIGIFHLQYLFKISNYYSFSDKHIDKSSLFHRPPPVAISF